MNINPTILPLYQRLKLFLSKQLGCGNFIQYSVTNNPYQNNDFLFLEKPFKTFTGETINSFSLSSLKDVVDNYASWYRKSGVRENDPVAIYLDDGIGYFIHYLALNNLGAIPVLVNGRMDADIAADFIRRVGAIGLYSDQKHLDSISGYVKTNDSLKFIATDVKNTSVQSSEIQFPQWYPYSPTDSHPIMICHSSGTTGKPKPVIFGHQQFFFGKRIRLLNFPASQSDKFLFALPSSHSAGISYFMTVTLLGLPTMVLSDLSGKNAITQAEELKPTIVAAFPQTYADMASQALEKDQLSSVKMWINTGDAAHEAHIRTLVNAGNSKSVFIDGLGASELGMALFNKVSSRQTSLYNRYMGKPRSFVKAVVLDEEGNLLPPYQVGFLGIKSPTITPGYWNDSNRTLKSYKQGYWISGDLAYYDQENKFFHVDRAVDAIQCARGLVNTLPIEELILKNNSAVADCTIIGVPKEKGFDGLVAFIKLKTQESIKASALITAINHQLLYNNLEPLSFLEIVSNLPVGSTGKVLKRKLREQYQDILICAEHNLEAKGIHDFAYAAQTKVPVRS
ncbi:class I adenylate-forming enzyme family protein [Moorena producens JHB]|uniref:Class I adenylate-forming enzyme family protein n=1 Tax=Moorena producens (strain JHB) TaxID=1454205 RepID=A0A1D9FZI5_MOOP1|nr:class I adenylate-forming enzyme family protein [Moorena producens]AOY80674.1 class I adenylate-forming enzyme family protein [Moorena producens JHB]